VCSSDLGVVVIAASQLQQVLYQAEDLLAMEAKLAAAVRSQAPLEEVHAALQWKKRPRA
jgi:hypothetical protein